MDGTAGPGARWGRVADLAVAPLSLVGSLCFFFPPLHRGGAVCFAAGSAAMTVAAVMRLRGA